jgi:hypothetical protein
MPACRLCNNNTAHSTQHIITQARIVHVVELTNPNTLGSTTHAIVFGARLSQTHRQHTAEHTRTQRTHQYASRLILVVCDVDSVRLHVIDGP